MDIYLLLEHSYFFFQVVILKSKMNALEVWKERRLKFLFLSAFHYGLLYKLLCRHVIGTTVLFFIWSRISGRLIRGGGGWTHKHLDTNFVEGSGGILPEMEFWN